MQSEVIEQILQAEKRAEEIVAASDREAKKIILDAQNRASEIVRKAEAEKKAETDSKLKTAQDESRNRIAEYRSEQMKRLDDSASPSSPWVEKASDEALELVCRVDLLEDRA